MAYIDQERKAILAAKVKEVVPKSWKYSLAIQHHSSIVMTIKSAPVDLSNGKGYIQLNPYYPETHYSGETLETVRKILDALNTGNHDNSISQIDYFDVGWYVKIDIGKWNKPFEVK